MTSIFKFGRNQHDGRRPRRPSLIGTYESMVASGEIDASDAEERFHDILARARMEEQDP